MRTAILASIVFLATVAAASAACPVVVQSQNTQDLFKELPALNLDLQSCPALIPSPANKFAGSGNAELLVNMQDGTSRYICMTTLNNGLTGVSESRCTSAAATMRISKGNLDGVLQSGSRSAAMSRLFLSGQLTIKPKSIFKQVALFITKPFVTSAIKQATKQTPYPGPPDHCDETVAGYHPGYTYAGKLWDSYSADTDGVCQMQQGYLPDGHCIYSVQQGTQNVLFVYYLCWYRN